MDNNDILVEASHLTKIFDHANALSDVSVTIGPGRIVGLLGPNGVGKSTLLRHMIGLYLPDQGTCKTFGIPCNLLGESELHRLGYVHQEGELISWMRADQFLAFVSAYYPTWNDQLQKTLVKKFEIRLDQRIGIMSPGQRQKLAIVAAVSYEPPLLLLDEPAAALDPVARSEVMEFLLEIIQNPARTIVISSHILTDIEKVADQIIIMKYGRITRDCSLDALREEYSQIEIITPDAAKLDQLPQTGIVEQKRSAGRAIITVRQASKDRLIEAARQAGASAEATPLPLDEIYRLEMKSAL